MSEAKLTRKILTNLRKQFGGVWWKIHANVFQGKTTLDIFGVVLGKFFALEVKLPGKENELTKIQAFMIGRINKNGGHAKMVTSFKQAKNFVRRVLES